MFNYSLRAKLNLIMLLIALIALVGVFVYVADSQAKDLTVYSQSQVLATALESYYDKYNRYPATPRVAADGVMIITENGINQPGKVVYYRQNFYFSKELTLASTAQDYSLEFTSDNKWPLWEAERGSLCRLSGGLKLSCQPR